MIHEVSRNPPSESAMAGVAVARSVWSTAAMNIGRKTATKMLRNWARVTVAGGPPEADAIAGSVPAVVADLDHAVLDTHRELGDRLVSRWRRHLAGADVEARAVAHAFDLVAQHAAAGQLAAVVRAHILDCVVLTAEVEDRDVRAVGIDQPMAAGLDLACFRYVDPVRHL